MSKEIRDKYKTVNSHSSCEIKIQKSRFISNLYNLKTNEDVTLFLNTIKKKYYDAKHHPFAYRIGMDKNNFRYNDDGEPSGSSGKPILDAIDKYDLVDVIIIVTRYFGGVKLGVGGLKRAYFESAEECIKNSIISEKFIFKNYAISFDYIFINTIMNFLEKNNIKIITNNSDEKVNLICELRLSLISEFIQNIINITKGSARIEKL